MRRAIVSQGTDHTNVYGYVCVEVLDAEGRVDEDFRLPDGIAKECREQWPMTGCRGINAAEKMVAEAMIRLGFEVLDQDYKPWSL